VTYRVHQHRAHIAAAHRVEPSAALPATPGEAATRRGPRLPAPRRLRALLAAAALAATALVGQGNAAFAAGSHDPFGHLDGSVGVAKTGVSLRGWAADPDASGQPVTVVVVIDGLRAADLVTNVSRPDVAAAMHVGPNTGFQATVPTVPGTHHVCVNLRNIGAGASSTLGCVDVAVAALTPTEQAAQAAHSPAGFIDSATVAGTTVTVGGWAIDPDQPTLPLPITATVDGKAAALAGLTTVARPDVQVAKLAGPDQGYRFTTVIAVNGLHTVCVTAGNLGPGVSTQIGCSTIRIGPAPLTPAQIAAHSPSGALQSATALGATGIRLTGWASDPDNRGYPLTVVAYTEGAAHTPVRASLPTPALAAGQQAGANAGFSFTVSVAPGPHNVCLWAVNIGIGADQALGCQALSTPAVAMPAGPTPPTPAVNSKIALAASKFLGGKYVWGAEDPKVGFDCSGLVQYTYRASGVSTPRVAQDQFSGARMITAGRAVPGDLVFFHDDLGYVYHVGIYAGKGMMYAAVDPAEGIRYQAIWDSTATYGSYTHS
jgi:cell wall-associated NlpC family hydrolase